MILGGKSKHELSDRLVAKDAHCRHDQWPLELKTLQEHIRHRFTFRRKKDDIRPNIDWRGVIDKTKELN
jgi:hypothetical protein